MFKSFFDLSSLLKVTPVTSESNAINFKSISLDSPMLELHPTKKIIYSFKYLKMAMLSEFLPTTIFEFEKIIDLTSPFSLKP